MGEFGFWLAVAVVLAAWMLSGALKERDKARQKQEMIRALLTAEGKNTTEILAYLRERDAAEQKREHDLWVATNAAGRKLLAIVVSLIAGIVVFFIGVRISNGLDLKGLIAFTPIAAGALTTLLIYFLTRGKKNVPPPGA